jgi:uncharacterized protein
MSHPVVWFEVLGNDGAKLQKYYQDLFDWKITVDNPMNYGMVETGSKRGVPGGIGESGKEGTKSWVTFYVECPDINTSLASAKKLGGAVVMPVTRMPGGPTLAMFSDPEGHLIGLIQSEPSQA